MLFLKIRRREVRCVENVGDEPITVLAKFCDAQVIMMMILLKLQRSRQVAAKYWGVLQWALLSSSSSLSPKSSSISSWSSWSSGATKFWGDLRGALSRALCRRSVELVERLQRCENASYFSFFCCDWFDLFFWSLWLNLMDLWSLRSPI